MEKVEKIMETIGENGKGFNVHIVRESPVITLVDRDWNGGSTREIYLDELKRAEIGTEFRVNRNDGCGRDVHSEVLTVLMKNKNGILCHLLADYTSDDSNPESWSEEELIWVSYARG